MNTSRKFLFNVGCLALLAPIGITIVLVVLHLSGLINAWIFPIIHVSAFCIFGGICCLALAQGIDGRQNQRSLVNQYYKRTGYRLIANYGTQL